MSERKENKVVIRSPSKEDPLIRRDRERRAWVDKNPIAMFPQNPLVPDETKQEQGKK